MNMMNEDNLGQLFREALKEFEKQPSKGVWNSVQSHLSGVKAPLRVNPLAKNLLISVSAVVITSVICLLAYNFISNRKSNSNTTTTIQQQVQVRNEQQVSHIPEMVNEPVKHQKVINYPKLNNSNITIPATNLNTDNNPVPQVNKKEERDTVKLLNNVANIEKPRQLNVVSENTQNPSLGNTPEVNNDEDIQSPKLSSDISYDAEKTICKGSSVTLHAGGGVLYQWANGETTDSITVAPLISSAYHIAITDKNGNVHEGIINVNVTDCNSYIAPKAFTPNGDGVLDVFFAYVKDARDFQMIIYSRSGEKVFESKNPDEGWDGNVKGMRAPVGAYVYIIKFTDAFGQEHDLKGSVTLIR